MAEFVVEEIKPKQFPKLTSLWESSPKYLFHLPSYSAAVCNDCVVLGVRKGNDYIAAFYFVVQRGTLEKRWLSPYFTPFCGPMAPCEYYVLNSKSERFWRDCYAALIEYSAQFPSSCTLITAPGAEDVRTLQWSGWAVTPHYNYVSRWQKEGEWWDQWDNAVRRQTNKARDEGLECVVHLSSKTTVLQDLWRKNAAHQGLDERLAENLESLGNWLQQVESGFIVIVQEASGKPHAAGLFGNDYNRVYYLAGASDPDCHGSGAPSLLHARAFEEIEIQNLPKCYDWVGANTDNIVSFKRKFNPTLEVYMRATYQSKRGSWIAKLRS